LSDLFYAFRKAKADCFFEKSICAARQFVDYEKDLPIHLSDLLARLQAGEIQKVLFENLGQPRLVAKKLGLEPIEQTRTKKSNEFGGHGFFSDPARALSRLCATHSLLPEFRIVGDFPVTMHVLSALWINKVGHKFDAALSRSACGSRLRRYRAEPGAPPGTVGEYHTESIGSFQPYFGPYKRWRELGLHAIRTELLADRPVVAVSLDFTSYYHRIDPTFIVDKRFREAAGVQTNDWENEFTACFVDALKSWSTIVGSKEMRAMGAEAQDDDMMGLPIGLSVSRVMANALLVELDRDLEQGLTPVYYGRYVDDMFLVLRDPGNLDSTEQVFRFIAARTKSFPLRRKKGEEVSLTLPGQYQGKTKLTLHQEKQKIFFLAGQGGLDLLDNIESQIRSVSSERRLMPSPDRLTSMASAKVLTAAGHPSEEADTLRRADGLSVRRLGWSIQLRAVETLARDLGRGDWKKERGEFYQFAHSHILRPDIILDHIDYLPRLLSLAVALADWPEARRLVDSTMEALAALREATDGKSIKINGNRVPLPSPKVWEALDKGVLEQAGTAIVGSLRWSTKDGAPAPLSETALALCKWVGLGTASQERVV